MAQPLKKNKLNIRDFFIILSSQMKKEYHKLFQLPVLTHALPRYSLATVFGTNKLNKGKSGGISSIRLRYC